MRNTRYQIEQDQETKNYIVYDNQSEIKVHHEDGTITQGTFVAGFKSKQDAQKFCDRMMLRHVWGK